VLHDVHVLGFPIAVFERSRRHTEALLREFDFIARGGERDETPARLVELVEDLTSRFGGLNADTEARADDAVSRGEEAIDLVYRLPIGARAASVALNRMLDEADEFCRRGDLLTLATPADLVAFRRWFLGEIIRQLDGGAPRPWDATNGPS
jgi:hypothetical protein